MQSNTSLMPSWLLTIGTIITFLSSFIVAGHGAIPVGLFLILGWEYQFFATYFGCFGIVLLASGKLFKKSKFCMFGILLIFISWITAISYSEIIETLAMSFPFLICLFFWGKNFLLFITED